MRTIPQRELRNNISRILRDVEQGEQIRVTVDGRPVVDLVPVGGLRRTFVPLGEVLQVLAEAPLDPAIRDDIAEVAGATIDELWPKDQ